MSKEYGKDRVARDFIVTILFICYVFFIIEVVSNWLPRAEGFWWWAGNIITALMVVLSMFVTLALIVSAGKADKERDGD